MPSIFTNFRNSLKNLWEILLATSFSCLPFWQTNLNDEVRDSSTVGVGTAGVGIVKAFLGQNTNKVAQWKALNPLAKGDKPPRRNLLHRPHTRLVFHRDEEKPTKSCFRLNTSLVCSNQFEIPWVRHMPLESNVRAFFWATQFFFCPRNAFTTSWGATHPPSQQKGGVGGLVGGRLWRCFLGKTRIK